MKIFIVFGFFLIKKKTKTKQPKTERKHVHK